METKVLTRAEKKQRTRARVLDAAVQLFARQGFGATRTADVARAAGVSHGTVFVHFPSKDELIVEAFLYAARSISERIHELALRGGGSVREVLEAHLEGLAVHEELYARAVLEGPQLPHQARSQILGLQAAISHHLSAAAAPAMERGELKTLPMHLLFNGWLGLVHHYLINRDLFAPAQLVLRAKGAELVDYYLRLLRP